MHPNWLAPRTRSLRLLVLMSGSLTMLLAVAGCGQVTGLAGNRTMPTPTWPLKQVAIATMEAQETALANAPHPPKPSPVSGTPISSCPIPTPQPGIFAPDLPTQGYADAVVDNSTAVMPADQPLYDYAILAGNRKSNPLQGLLIVMRLVSDPCANPTSGSEWTYYDTPVQQGHVQLISTAGDTVTFMTASGGGHTYRFDFVTGQFL